MTVPISQYYFILTIPILFYFNDVSFFHAVCILIFKVFNFCQVMHIILYAYLYYTQLHFICNFSKLKKKKLCYNYYIFERNMSDLR